MTTATKTKAKPDVLAELERLDTALAEAEQAAKEAGEEHDRVIRRARELVEQRQHEIALDPELVDHRGHPVAANNAVAKIDKQLGEVGDIDDLTRRRDHARSIAEKKRQAVHRHVAQNLDAILEGLTPEAEDVAAAVQSAAAGLADAAAGYMAFARRIAGLRAASPRFTRLRSGALESGKQVEKTAAGYRDERLPLATELR